MGQVRPVDAMVVGAQKAGTSTLAHYIEQLPGVSTHKLDLEFTYFVDDERYAKGYDSAFSRYFSDAAPSGLLFAKSAGVMFIEGAVNRLAEHNPQVKVIAMLREPVSRAYSAYWYLRRVGIEDAPTFEEGLAREEQRMRSDPRLHMAYRARGDYLPQLRRLVDVFGAAQVRIELLDDLHVHPRRLTDDLGTWLGLDTDAEVSFTPVNESAGVRNRRVARVLHQPHTSLARLGRMMPTAMRRRALGKLTQLNERRAAIPPMAPDTRAMLQEYYAPLNAKLSAYLNRDLRMWDPQALPEAAPSAGE